MGLGHNLSGKVEPFAEVVEALGGEGVVVVLPREASLEVAARGQGLAYLLLNLSYSGAKQGNIQAFCVMLALQLKYQGGLPLTTT